MPKNIQKKDQIMVSYIMATKNRCKYLEKTFENIREFITKQDELIIIDGGSTDDTKKIVEKNKDIVTYFESVKDYGEAHALNKGILNSNGKYIKFLADDDYIYPDTMKYVISVLEKNPEIDALQCGGEAYQYNKKIKKEELLFYEKVNSGIKIANNFVHVSTFCPCGLGLIITRRIISRAGLIDTTFLASDLSYISNLIKCRANFKYLNVSLFKHINYTHSGENKIEDIHYDEGRVWIVHHEWEKVMSVETSILERIFGLDKLEKGTELLRSIKLLDFLRRKKIYFPIVILDFIAKQRNILSKMNKFLAMSIKQKYFKPKIQKGTPPIPPIRDGKFW